MAESKAGNFSFWLGKNHVVGVSGEAARKMYLDDRSLHLIKGITLIGHGPDFIDGRSTVIHDIWKSTGSSGRTYAQRRLLDLQRNDQLTKRLPRVTEDARRAFQALSDAPSNVINPSKICYRVVVQQGARIVGSDTIADDPKLMEPLLKYMPILQFTSSLHLLAFPCLSYFSASYWKRKYGRWGVTNIVKPIVDKRMAPGAAPVDDALQTLINAGDSKDYITNFMISMLFIAGANSGVISGSMLNIVAHHPDWQEKIFQEIKASASKYAKNQNASLVDQLDSLPLEGWEKMSASIDLCYTEAIRMWVAFPMGRFNDTSKAIPIPDTDEVIPPGSFACYNTGDVHYSEKLYPNPMKWEPERWQEGREEFKQEAYGCKLLPILPVNEGQLLTLIFQSWAGAQAVTLASACAGPRSSRTCFWLTRLRCTSGLGVMRTASRRLSSSNPLMLWTILRRSSRRVLTASLNQGRCNLHSFMASR